MNYLYVKGNELGKYEESVLALLMMCDDDFYPSLSSRRINRTGSQDQKTNLQLYIRDKHDFGYILCLDEERVIGFVNWEYEYQADGFHRYPKNAYFDTVLVHPAKRATAIPLFLYRQAENRLRDERIRYIGTSTWSTHAMQIRFFERLGMKRFNQGNDDRGNGISSVHYIKEV